ncbi:MAG: hypothetical protein ACOYNI_03360 [Acidimicrobiia bacterium]
MAKSPDPSLPLTSLAGTTRTLDDWSTMFHLALIVLPDKPQGSAFLPLVRKIYGLFGDSDCRCSIVVPSTPAITKRILGGLEQDVLTFVDPDRALVSSLALSQLPAFVHLRQDTSLVDAAEGWDLDAWQRVTNGLTAAMQWGRLDLGMAGGPVRPTAWAV